MYGNGPNRMSINKTILFLIKNTNISEMYFLNRGKYWSALRNYGNLPIWSHTHGYNLHYVYSYVTETMIFMLVGDYSSKMKSLLVSVAIIALGTSAVKPDCSRVDKNAAVACAGSVLQGEGLCGEDVCARVRVLEFISSQNKDYVGRM